MQIKADFNGATVSGAAFLQSSRVLELEIFEWTLAGEVNCVFRRRGKVLELEDSN